MDAPPLLAFERWRFAAKFAEDAAAAPAQRAGAAPDTGRGVKPGKPRAAADPVIPSPRGADAQLVADLVRSGMPNLAAAAAAEDLAAAARRAAAEVAKLGARLRSGPPPPATAAGLRVAFHMHSLDLTAGGGSAAEPAGDAQRPGGSATSGAASTQGNVRKPEGAGRPGGSAAARAAPASGNAENPATPARQSGDKKRRRQDARVTSGAPDGVLGAGGAVNAPAAFVKLSREAYARLAMLHRQHGAPAEVPDADAEVLSAPSMGQMSESVHLLRVTIQYCS